VLEAAKRRGVPVEIVEWPGGQPKPIDRDVAPQIFAAVRKGRMSVPLGKEPNFAEVAGLPSCTVATLHSDGDMLYRVVGPAIRQPDQWVVPVLYLDPDPATGVAEYKKEAEKLREAWGLKANSVP
jgi:hypothetical protein